MAGGMQHYWNAPIAFTRAFLGVYFLSFLKKNEKSYKNYSTETFLKFLFF